MSAYGLIRRTSIHYIASLGTKSGPTLPHTLSQPDSSILFEIPTVKSTSSKLRTLDSTLLRLVLFRRGENSCSTPAVGSRLSCHFLTFLAMACQISHAPVNRGP